MVDDGYLIGYEDGTGSFVEVGRFNNFDESVTGPILLKHADSGETLEIDASGFDFTGPLDAPSATIDGKSSPYATETEVNAKADDPHDNTQHSETYTTTSDDVENFSTSGADGTVPTSQGDGSLAMEAVTGTALAWDEDGNSPKTVTSSTSLSYTFASSWDQVKVVLQVTSTNTAQIELTVNGDTGANYNTIDLSGGTSFGVSSVQVNVVTTPSKDTTAFDMTGRWGDDWQFNGDGPTRDNSTIAHRAENGNVTSPLSSFNLDFINSMDEAIVEVYGRNVE